MSEEYWYIMIYNRDCSFRCYPIWTMKMDLPLGICSYGKSKSDLDIRDKCCEENCSLKIKEDDKND